MALNTQSLSVSVHAPMAKRPLPSIPQSQEISGRRFPVLKKQVTFEPAALVTLSSSLPPFQQQYRPQQQQQQQQTQPETIRQPEAKRRKQRLRLKVRTQRNRFLYWDNPFVGRIILAQIVSVAVIFICQCIILVKFGDPLFTILVGLGIGFWMPLMYTLGLLQSLYTHALPTYFKISFACLVQGLTSYSAIFMITRDVAYMIHLESYNMYLTEPWILWLIIFMMTCYMSLTSLILLLVSIHDICYFRQTIKHPIRRYVVRVKNISQLVKLRQSEKTTHQIQIDEEHANPNNYSQHHQRQSLSSLRGGRQDLETSFGNFHGDFDYI